MTSESGRFTASYDVYYNLQKLNGESIVTDSLNQIQNLPYDPNGNLIRPRFVYDEFDQLIEAEGEKMTYDALGRRIQKGQTAFLYIGHEEIGAFQQNSPKELKILGIKTPIAVEIDQIPYTPILDAQGIIRSLIDHQTKTIVKQNHCDAFANGLSSDIPYAYSGKRYDPNTSLLYFGKRYYDPSLRRWLTPDPIGPLNHSNVYQYLFNNPYLYQDDTGEFAFAIPILLLGAELALPSLSMCITGIVCTATASAVAYGGYKLVEALNTQGCPTFGDYYSGDLTPGLNDWTYMTMKSGSVDSSLPANPDELLERPDWKESTHPDAGKRGHRTFENQETGEKLRHDEAKSEAPGHRGESHWHRFNPNSQSNRDKYLDANGNPVPKNSPESHLYPSK